MDSDTRDAAPVRFPPLLVYVLAVAAGVLLQALAGTSWTDDAPLAARVGLAAALALPGLALIAGALRLFRSTGQDPKPWTASPAIVSSGVYRFSRNPMYVGLALLQAAFGAALANPWIVALVPVALGVIFAIAVRHEEAYLERKFGQTYLAYKASVRRWL